MDTDHDATHGTSGDHPSTPHGDPHHIDLFHVDPSVLDHGADTLPALRNLGGAGSGHGHHGGSHDPGTDVEVGGAKVHIETADEGHGIHLGPAPNVQVTISPAHQEYDPHHPLSDWVPSFTPYFEIGGDPPDGGPEAHPAGAGDPFDHHEPDPEDTPDQP